MERRSPALLKGQLDRRTGPLDHPLTTEKNQSQDRSRTPELEPAPATLIIVRHGQTVWNAQGRWQGWLDSPLTEFGRMQARSAREELRSAPIDVAYSSDAGRALETARIILADRPHVPLHEAPELRERSYGAYEGLNTEEIDARYPNTRFDPDRDRRETWRAPGDNAESLEEVRARLQPFLTELARRHAGESVLVVTHSNVVRLVDALCCGQPLEEIWHRAPHNACVFIVEARADGRMDVVKHFCED